jgi:hypothetical protein
MLVYFDTKDLINILEKGLPLSAAELHKRLSKSDHSLVLSLTTIMELSEPLLHRSAKTNVTRLLNLLEGLPHIFIHNAAIPRLELEEAHRAFSTGEECKKINPFVKRFDDTVQLYAKPPTKIYLNYPLSEVVWDLYTFGALGGMDNYAKRLKPTFAADRAISPRPSLKDNFVKTIGLNLALHNVAVPSADIPTFAEWVYSNPSRCPGERLGYEVWHKMVRNVTDEPEHSDLEDLLHVGCLPYVDLATLDRRMYGYVMQSSVSLGLGYDEVVFRKPIEAIERL